ncbi:MAG: 4-hydroxythreonine-4-phosphate dehydrogenase PdxA, partial [Gemmatimonadota bacterium]
AVAEARARGWRVAGPVPADSVFNQCLEGRYDGVLSLYHDQGHIAAKTLDFHGTVSYTMGLEFLRTSVDHGTAFGIAGKGMADARGMVAAVLAAGQYAVAVKERLDLQPVG